MAALGTSFTRRIPGLVRYLLQLDRRAATISSRDGLVTDDGTPDTDEERTMTTNYTDTFIEVAPDCVVTAAEPPPTRRGAATVANLQYALLIDAPYRYTSDELLFEVHVTRAAISETDRPRELAVFLARPQPCLRSSPLPKRYGWGIHHDSAGRIALVALGSAHYDELLENDAVRRVRALASRRS